MNPIRITAVSYYNTLPFIYGLNHSGLLSGFELSLDVPSECARKIISNEADIGLIPVGALPGISDYQLVSNLCIGADKDVKSVLLLANVALHELKTIYLDTDSLTSVNLVRILSSQHWKINPQWKSLSALKGKLAPDEGMVLIGDKTFGLSSQYPFCYDLAGEWIKYTGLPFVFAVWISRKPLPEDFNNSFQAALAWGVDHRENSVSMARKSHITEDQLVSYLKNDISYQLDDAKVKGMEMFLKLLSSTDT
ncbi:MAG: menaquinone biosynthesis protein [Lentimicrobiaceae bacterium]|jgi:chorismate dehydratase